MQAASGTAKLAHDPLLWFCIIKNAAPVGSHLIYVYMVWISQNGFKHMYETFENKYPYIESRLNLKVAWCTSP